MLAKLTRGNQFTIPKLIIQKAQLQAGRDYLDVTKLSPEKIAERRKEFDVVKAVAKAKREGS